MKKRIYTLLSMAWLFVVAVTAQSTITNTQYPNKDSQVSHNLNPTYAYADTTNYSTRTFINAQAGTVSGYNLYTRSYIGLDLSTIPSGATINSAQLTLYGGGGGSHQNTTLNGSGYQSNACWLRRTTQAWTINKITWNNQPTTTTTNQVALASSTSATQDYTCDITQLVKDMIANPAQGSGLELILQSETQYCMMAFNSSEYSDATKHPKLIVVYTFTGVTYTLTLPVTTNYIHTSVPQKAMSTVPASTLVHTVGDVSDNIQYFDGLGRPVQTVDVAASPNKKDVIQPQGYDSYGRENVKYLPYTDLAINGTYRSNAVPAINAVTSSTYSSSDQYKFYQNGFSNATNVANDAYPYAQTVFEASPLNRVLEQGAPGADWQPSSTSITNSGHTQKLAYQTNTAGEVKLFTVDSNNNLVLASTNNTYAAGQLYVTQTTDENENGNKVKEYKDKEDHIILKKSYNGKDSLQTYYVYDDFGMLRYVLPPEFIRQYITTGSLNASSTLIKQYAYYYQYDGRQRMVLKQLPGADSVLMVYDKRDRLVLTQDGNMRPNKQWLFTKYDALNRPVLTGIITYSSAMGRTTIQSSLDNTIYGGRTPRDYYVTRNNSLTNGYTDASYPLATDGTISYLTATYYDTYGFPGVKAFDTGNNISGYTDSEGSYTTYFEQLKGQVTGTRTLILGTTTYLTTTHYYDDRYRMIQERRDLYDGANGTETVSNKYDFVGKLLSTKQVQTATPAGATAAVTNTVVIQNSYDHAGRLTYTYQQVNSGTNEMIAKNEYNELGQLVTKKLHNETTPLQTLNYTYNIRGWLKKINDPASLGSDVFGEELLYNEGLSVLGGTAQYNGNISGMKYHTAGSYTSGSTTAGYNSQYQGYGFTYDGLNRLLNANYGYSTTSTLARSTNYDASVTGYDFNGNITGMKQNGYTGTAYGTIDNLAYTYTGNQLTNVKESATLTSGLDFTESSTSTTATEYTYDANGNMLKDLNKNAQVAYNVLNLPAQVTMLSSSKTINYIYSAAGEKLRETADGTTRYYFGNMVYKGKTLDYIITPEGIADNANGTIVYNYNLKDHLGNVRAVVQPKTDGTALLVQEKDYYPFGLAFKQSNAVNSENRYLYNGKEMQDDLGLNWYDYGARFYDPQIGRWHSVDPLAEKDYGWAPYRYGYNNPIRYWDVGGKFEMDRNQAQQYKRLAIFLQNSMSSIASNRKIVDGLMKYGQLSEDKIRTDLQWGQGPKIVITDINAKFGHKSYGLFSSQTANILYINEREVKRFEETGKISDGLLLFLVNTILHEYTHYGDNMAKKSFEGETGEEFEKNVFGGIINAEFCDFFLQVLKDEAQKEDAKAQENKEENPQKASAFTDMISNFSNLEEGKYTWDGSNWVKQ